MHVLVHFGADGALGRMGPPTAVGDEGNGHGWPFPDAAHRERSELGELCRLAGSLASSGLKRASTESRTSSHREIFPAADAYYLYENQGLQELIVSFLVSDTPTAPLQSILYERGSAERLGEPRILRAQRGVFGEFLSSPTIALSESG